MKSLIKSFKIPNLNKREKILLITFLIVFICWSFNTLALKPQAEKIEGLKSTKAELDKELNKINEILQEENENRDQISDIESSVIKIGSAYFPNLNQIQLIYYLEDIFSGNEVIVRNLTFSDTEFLIVDDFEVQYITILIHFEGKYEGIKTLIKTFNNSSFKVIIESLYLVDINKENLEGEILIKVFCLEDIIDLPINDLIITSNDDEESYEGFNPFEEELETSEDKEVDDNSYYESTTNDNNNAYIPNDTQGNKGETINKTIIDNFDSTNYYFISSHELISGSVNRVTENNNDYLRFEYWIQKNDEENRAYIDMSKRKIEFRYPVSKLYLTIKSYNYSHGTLGIRFKTQEDEDIDILISEGIGWTGWNSIEFNLPTKLSLYPLEMTHIYYEIPNGSEDMGVLKFDKLEAVLPNYNVEMNDFYIVKEQDSLASISKKIYGSDEYADEIIKINNLSSKEEIKPGKILILRRK